VTYTRYVLQGIPVMAVGQAIRPEPDADLTGEISATPEVDQGTVQEGEAPALSTVFTLEVTPEEAEKLVFAQSSGSLYYTLVPEDFVEVDTRGVTIEQLFEGDLVEDIFGNN
jgi:Flp pilus assembly protein CpaB